MFLVVRWCMGFCWKILRILRCGRVVFSLIFLRFVGLVMVRYF